MIERRIGLRLALLALLPCVAGRAALHYRFNITYAPPPATAASTALSHHHTHSPPPPPSPHLSSPSSAPFSVSSSAAVAAVATTTNAPRLTPHASRLSLTVHPSPPAGRPASPAA